MKNPLKALLRWIDSAAAAPDPAGEGGDARRTDWLRVLPFIAIHAGCLGVFWLSPSAELVALAAALFAARMFAITAFYHRYFAHRTFRTSRAVQFLFALAGAAAAQRGPLWWASHHRHHHAHADRPEDAHSALQHGFAWSHAGWFLSRANFAARHELVPDLARYPELRLLDRFDVLVPALLAAVLYAAGGLQFLVWGFCISTVALWHATFTINSLAHRYGRRRYATKDDSRNNLWLALLTFGEGWHNNHHHYPVAARQGFYWWEIDLAYYGLRLLSAAGLVWDLRPVPAAVREARRERAR
jgi:stearoyl-CoA desaturase (delta-9 desaturase)